MKKAVLFAWCGLVALGATACSKARDTGSGTAFCFNCHSETSALGVKIKWAEAGYAESRHGAGALSATLAPAPVYGICPSFVAASSGVCTTNGGKFTATGSICTMAASVNKTQCDAATVGGTAATGGAAAWVPYVGQAASCLPFSQAAATQTALNSCTRVFGPGAYAGTTCTPPATATQSGCESAGGVWLGPINTIVGYEREGSRSFNLNAYGCQMCHTQEGWRKRVANAYNTGSLDIGLDSSNTLHWDAGAWATKDVPTPFVPSGVTYSQPWLPASVSPLAADTILNPSPLGCFGCHTPHGMGTPDGQTLTQTIPPGSVVNTQAGSVWGNASTPVARGSAPKEKGHLCASCHQIRMNQYSSLANYLEQTIKGPTSTVLRPDGTAYTGPGSTPTTFSFPNPHDSPVADMVLGKGGAEYTGTVTGTAGTFGFNGSYGSSAHAATAGADCISCHMASDYGEIDVVNRFGLSPAINGHSFANKGIAFGVPKASAIGCGSSGCHVVANVNNPTSLTSMVIATTVGANGVTPSPSSGYLQAGAPLFLYGTCTTGADCSGGPVLTGNFKNFTDSAYHLKVNELLMKLANPDIGCQGLLTQAAASAGKTVSMSYSYGINWGPEAACSPGGSNALDANAVGHYADNTNVSLRLAKAVWNFGFLKNEQSWGVHNTRYALELLYDSCMDMAVMAGVDCGPNAGRCAACEGTFLTTRP